MRSVSRITIQTKDGPKRVRVRWANAQWAVHRTYVRKSQRRGLTNGRCWTLTHRPSGQAFIKHIDWRQAPAILQQVYAVVKAHDATFSPELCACEQEHP